jgi:hypothetical protein
LVSCHSNPLSTRSLSSLLLLELSAPGWLDVLVSAQPYCELHKKFVLAILSEDFIVSDLGLER